MRVVCACLLLALVASAKAADVDWRMYGFAALDASSACFYDANSMSRTADGHIRVWTKCVLQTDLDGVNSNSELGRKIAETAGAKIVGGYVPPIIAIGEIEFSQISGVVGFEESADLGNVEPRARIFYEIDCSQRMVRHLDAYVRTHGEDEIDHNPSPWEYVPPEGNAANLSKMVCPVSLRQDQSK